MALLRILAAVALVAMFAVPATADAAGRGARKAPQQATKAAAQSPLTAASAVALRYWGAAPCGGDVKVVAKQPLAAGLGAESDAWVTFTTPLGPNQLAAPAASYTACTIAFGRSRWPTTASMRQDWPIFCATMVHEWGHLMGHAHDATPGNVMVPVFSDYSSVPALCRSAKPARAAR